MERPRTRNSSSPKKTMNACGLRAVLPRGLPSGRAAARRFVLLRCLPCLMVHTERALACQPGVKTMPSVRCGRDDTFRVRRVRVDNRRTRMPALGLTSRPRRSSRRCCFSSARRYLRCLPPPRSWRQIAWEHCSPDAVLPGPSPLACPQFAAAARLVLQIARLAD